MHFVHFPSLLAARLLSLELRHLSHMHIFVHLLCLNTFIGQQCSPLNRPSLSWCLCACLCCVIFDLQSDSAGNPAFELLGGSFSFHETNVLFSFPTSLRLHIYTVTWSSHAMIRKICVLLFKSSNKPAFHPFRKFHKSVMGILWAGIPQVLREHHRRIFPGILGPVQPQRQLI